ncbi:MAG: hypothetical protein ABR881_24860 [Candidatus Sulfotelmatobacter sp.]|jgi:hypothetical protein
MGEKRLYEKPAILQTFDEQDLFEQDGDTMHATAWTHTGTWNHSGKLNDQ